MYRRQKDLTLLGCFLVVVSWLLVAVGLVVGIWLGLDIALDGEIAKGVGIGLAIVVGSQVLAAIIGILGFVFVQES